jgi:transcriptional regulator with XRE-family HTH domain
MGDERSPLTANQLVGYNMARARKALGWSQEAAAARLEPYLGKRWSKNVYSAAEKSYEGKRVRNFDADELLAMSLAFGVPVGYFFLPPPPEARPAGAVAVSGPHDMPWFELLVAGNGYTHGPAVLWRLRELPRDEVPREIPDDELLRRFGSAPGS